jgi:hypothetical protein
MISAGVLSAKRHTPLRLYRPTLAAGGRAKNWLNGLTLQLAR